MKSVSIDTYIKILTNCAVCGETLQIKNVEENLQEDFHIIYIEPCNYCK